MFLSISGVTSACPTAYFLNSRLAAFLSCHPPGSLFIRAYGDSSPVYWHSYHLVIQVLLGSAVSSAGNLTTQFCYVCTILFCFTVSPLSDFTLPFVVSLCPSPLHHVFPQSSYHLQVTYSMCIYIFSSFVNC